MDRRKFLKSAAAVAALAGATSRAHSSGIKTAGEFRSCLSGECIKELKAKKVVIIGAGIAGLTVAYELEKCGVSYRLLEARHRPGGRVETVRGGDLVDEFDETQECRFSSERELYFNTGAARISQEHKGVLSYCRELGVNLELLANENMGGYFYSNSLNLLEPERLRNVQASLRGGISELLAKSVLDGGLSDFISVEEVPEYLALLAQFGDLSSDFTFRSSTRSGLVGNTGIMTPAIAVDPIPLKDIIKTDFYSQYKLHLSEYLDQQASMVQPTGGMDQIAYALAKATDASTEYSVVVTAAKRRGKKAVVEYEKEGRKHSIAADAVVVATPPNLALRMENDFSEGVASGLRRQQLSRPAKVAFQSERFWETEDNIFGGFSYTDQDITLLWYPSNGIGTKEGVVVGAYSAGVFPSETFGDLPVQERLRLSLEQGEMIHRRYSRRVQRGITRAWARTPFSEGGWSLVAPHDALLVADGPFVFAGDYISRMPGWMEGAVGSAHHALSLISAKA